MTTKTDAPVRNHAMNRLNRVKNQVLRDFEDTSISKEALAARYSAGTITLSKVINHWLGQGAWEARVYKKPSIDDRKARAIKLFNDSSLSKREICRMLQTHPDTLAERIDGWLGYGVWAKRKCDKHPPLSEKRKLSDSEIEHTAMVNATTLARHWNPTPTGMSGNYVR